MPWLTSTSCVPGARPRTTPFIAATYGPSRPKSLVSVRMGFVIVEPRRERRWRGDRGRSLGGSLVGRGDPGGDTASRRELADDDHLPRLRGRDEVVEDGVD